MLRVHLYLHLNVAINFYEIIVYKMTQNDIIFCLQILIDTILIIDLKMKCFVKRINKFIEIIIVHKTFFID